MSSSWCSTCKRQIETAIIKCVECEERFCTHCYRKCPTVRNHVPAHKYTVDQNDKSFLRKGYTYEQEKEILKVTFLLFILNLVQNYKTISRLIVFN